MGPIMKVKHFRIHAVTDQTTCQLGADLRARRNRCPPNSPTWSVLADRGTAAICDCFGHLSCFSFKRGGCQSPKVLQPTREKPESGRRDLPEDERS